MRLLSFKAVVLAVIVAIVFILFQYILKGNEPISTPQNVTLHFGQQGVEDFNTYTGGNVDVQPAGMSFFDLFWTPPNLGTVNIAHEEHTLTLDNVFSVLGSQKSSGINGIDMDSGLNKAEFVEPKEAYLAYKELLTQINQKGWQQYYAPYAPRVSKQNNLRSIKRSNEVTDPSYILSYEEWSDLFNSNPDQRLDYNLYLDGIIMNITLKKTKANEFGQEQYLLRYSFNTAGYIGVNLIEGGSKLEGAALKKAYEDTIKLALNDRSKQELNLQEQGYTIDENYESPDFWEYMK
ncbi:hypothetical protein [Psychrobacter fjordensis]|uniref:hypothetical protein n=1 Tax=Psychrobacter fjordensis TaxID=664424 RepID=UPI0019182F27|nr:hypothetical protein [Psychrobacter fjordensis]